MRVRCITWMLLAAAACLAGRAGAAEVPPQNKAPDRPVIRTGDRVRVKTNRAPLLLDDKPLMEVNKGTILTVLRVRGNMVGVSVDVGGRSLVAWIDGSKHVELVSDPNALSSAGAGRPTTIAVAIRRLGDLENVPVPEIEASVAALVERAGCVPAAPTAVIADATLEVQLTGIAIAESAALPSPGRAGPIYNGARVLGSVRLEARGGQSHAAEFSGAFELPKGAAGSKERTKAPFQDAWRASNFCDALLTAFAKVCGDRVLVCAVQKTDSGYPLVRNLESAAVAALATRVHRPDSLLIEALAESSVLARRGAARALGDATLAAKAGTRELARALLEALKDDDEEVRGYAALARVGDQTQAAPPATGLKDPDPEARIAAVQALGSVRTPEARRHLIAALADPDPGVRTNAVWRLHDFQHPDVAPPVLALLAGDKVPRVRAAAARLLAEMHERRAADALVAIAACDDKQFPGHPPQQVDEMREQAVRALRRVDAAKAATALPVLTAAVRDRSLRVRRAAVQELAALRSPEAVPGLVAAVVDEYEKLYNSTEDDSEWLAGNLREEALDALGAIKSERAVDPLIEALHLIHLPKQVTDRIGDTLARITGRTFEGDRAVEVIDYEGWRVWWDARLREAPEAR